MPRADVAVMRRSFCGGVASGCVAAHRPGRDGARARARAGRAPGTRRRQREFGDPDAWGQADDSAACSSQVRSGGWELFHRGRAASQCRARAPRSRRPCAAARRPAARPAGPASRTSTVGVRSGCRGAVRRSRCASASISTWVTPGTMPATSPSTRRVARQGAQKALENWTRVARSPSPVTEFRRAETACPRSAAGAGADPVPAPVDRIPVGAQPPSSTATHTTSPVITCNKHFTRTCKRFPLSPNSFPSCGNA
ncbi:hypothetical protein SALBM217S_03791 [Streptomyces griseoloalbus]